MQLRSTIKLFNYFSLRDQRLFLFIVIISIVQAFIETICVALIPVFVASLQSPSLVINSALGSKFYRLLGLSSETDLVYAISVVLLFSFMLRTVFGIYVMRTQLRYVERVQMELAHRMLMNFMSNPYEYHLTRNSNDMARAVVGELASVFTYMVTPIFTVVTEFLTASMVIVLLLSLQPTIATLTVVFFGFATIILYRTIRARVAQYGQSNLYNSRESLKWLNQALVGVKEAKFYGIEKFFADRFRAYSSASSRASNNNGMMAQLPKYFNEVLAVTAMVGLALVLIVQNDKSVLAILVLFAVAAMRVIPSFNRIVSIYSGFQFAGASIESVLCDLEGIKDNPYPSGGNAISSGLVANVGERFNELRVEGLAYAYKSGNFKLEVEFLSIKRGQRIAFVGASGSGKTTLIDIITGLLKPLSGRVTVNGTDIAKEHRKWRQTIGYIPQHIFLIDDSLRANIAFGVAAGCIDEDQVGNVIKAAQLGSFVEGLPEGRDTMTGDRGIRLSGGQRQRVGIARALYRNPDVLILDEGTSALDNVTEAQIVREINALGREKTVIIIAHRLSTVEGCDVIYVMKQGRIIAAGTYEELSNESADFKEMLRPNEG